MLIDPSKPANHVACCNYDGRKASSELKVLARTFELCDQFEKCQLNYIPTPQSTADQIKVFI